MAGLKNGEDDVEPLVEQVHHSLRRGVSVQNV